MVLLVASMEEEEPVALFDVQAREQNNLKPTSAAQVATGLSMTPSH